jgi:hypothetical protein
MGTVSRALMLKSVMVDAIKEAISSLDVLL